MPMRELGNDGSGELLSGSNSCSSCVGRDPVSTFGSVSVALDYVKFMEPFLVRWTGLNLWSLFWSAGLG